MFEYSSVSASTYDMASLVARINERAAEGWRVVSVVTAGADAVALLEREGTGTPVAAATTVTAAAAAVVAEPVAEPVAAVAPAAAEPVQEPAGWALEPTATSAVTAAASSAASAWGDTTATTPVQAVVEPVQAVVEPVVQQPVQQAPVTPAVPAGWYPDPSGRYEQRYWDGTQWTEHVARQGQQYTDPPVA